MLWRADRFKMLGEDTWYSDAEINGGCKNLAPVEPKQMRTKNVVVALKDKLASKRTVVVASVHWPRQQKKGDNFWKDFDAHACAEENMQEADKAVMNMDRTYKKDTKSVQIIAGDMNAKTSVDGWWKFATETLDYTDPIAKKCGQNVGSATAPDGLLACMDHVTNKLGKNRIDYLLIKGGGTTKDAAHTIAQPAKPYSGHQAIRASVLYSN